MIRRAQQAQGIGLIFAVALLAVVSVSIGLLAPAVFQVVAADNALGTAQDLQLLKTALAGNPRLVIGGGRADFGYVGTMGNIPSQLSALWTKSIQPQYAFNINKKAGSGWVGPYIPGAFMNDLLALDRDRFGNALIYTSTPFTRSSDGQTVAARIQSPGMDGTAGTVDDQLVDILSAEAFSTVTGTLTKGANPVTFATVTLNIPANGVLAQRYDVTDGNGLFEFAGVSFGFRSVSVDPKLTFEEGSASVIGGDTVRFTVTNYGTNDITIASIGASYAPAAYYERVEIGNATIFNYTNAPYNGTRAASGQIIAFAPGILIKGSGKPSQVVPIRVEKKTTVTPDVRIKGVGKSVVIRLEDFRNSQTGAAASINPSGVTFTIQFSDGSQNIFTIP